MDLPPLGWQSFIAKRLVTHYLYLAAWIQHLTLLARYGDVPLCNLDSDDPRYLIDISYARRLQQNNVVLWWSSGPLPDHAGYEKDDIQGATERVDMPSINTPGAYSTVCIELDVRNLAINTILTSSIINELEGSDSFLASGPSAEGDGSGVLYSEKAFASAGAHVLREMVKHWWTEACEGNSMADIMVQHLIRWVESPTCCLYDRALHNYVRLMSKKSFQQLMAEFRRVGSNVVFASPTRLLLQTTKTEVGNAYAYSQYVLKSIRGNPSFHFIDLEIKEYWDYLVWYDEYNYGGKGCREVIESENQELETVMHWQLSRFLPGPMQTIFHDWVVEYIELMHGLKRLEVDDSSTPRPTPIPIGRSADADGDEITSILTDRFSKPLKKQILGLIRRQRDELLHPELASDYTFPELPGVLVDPNDDKRNPTLELVKLLMQILSLSKLTTLETRLLRRELLALFEVREFSKEGRFENPSGSLKLPELTCSSCCLIRDLDLCRDEDVLPDPESDGNKTAKPWRCSFCHTEYDRLAQEEILIGQVQCLVVMWQVQDLKCSKCGSLKVSDFMEHCSCSGVWVETMDRKEVEKKLRVLASVAKFYGLKLLEGVVDEVLEGI